MPADQASAARMAATAAQDIHILLKPVSHPELGDISIEDDLFPIGRTETPFAAYPPGLVDVLSRRHARIFCERGGAYIADLDSKNGTAVNGVPVRERPARLKDGDEVRLGGELSYRVQLSHRKERPAPAARVIGVTLTPERSDLGLQPIAVTRFPFLVGKGDENFSRYREQFPHQVNYLSRRHAHIFLKGGQPWLEDLGSTNGTFVAGNRLDEHAVALQDGDLVAFGGHHFVYRVSLLKEKVLDPTVTRVAFTAGSEEGADTEKTTFVAAPDSFLDIFCVEPGPRGEDEINAEEAAPAEGEGKGSGRRRGKLAVFASELLQAFAGGEGRGPGRYLWWGAGALGLVVLAGIGLYLRGSGEREVKDLLADGQYARAATAADRHLGSHPDDAGMKALGTEAALKALVPPWVAQLRARDFDGALVTLAGLKPFEVHNADLQSLGAELAWIGDLERLFVTRGGSEAPIRIYGDEENIKKILRPWEEDPLAHQRALDRIASHVPEFRDFYPEALSHLRKIQSDDSVYVAAIERLKAAITTELNRDRPEALEEILKDYGEKYPRLGGLDAVREDLRRYREIEAEVQARRPDRVAALVAGTRFSTPPFQARISSLAENGRLPSAEVMKQFEAVSRSWREGNIEQALAGLQAIGSGPWAEPAARELARRKGIAEQFAALQASRGARDYGDRLLAFYGLLDPEEDAYFIRATEGDLAANREKALNQAKEAMGRSAALWARYRENGAIAEEQRAESAISGKFRDQARLLADARASARRGQKLFGLLKAEVPAPWSRLPAEIDGEAEQQRRSLQELRAVLDPGILKAKLGLIGESSGEQGKSP